MKNIKQAIGSRNREKYGHQKENCEKDLWHKRNQDDLDNGNLYDIFVTDICIKLLENRLEVVDMSSVSIRFWNLREK